MKLQLNKFPYHYGLKNQMRYITKKRTRFYFDPMIKKDIYYLKLNEQTLNANTIQEGIYVITCYEF